MSDNLDTCQICEEPADLGCADCVSGFYPSGTPMCEGCVSKHCKLKEFTRHTIISVSELRSIKANMQRAPRGVSKIRKIFTHMLKIITLENYCCRPLDVQAVLVDLVFSVYLAY